VLFIINTKGLIFVVCLQKTHRTRSEPTRIEVHRLFQSERQ